MEKIDEKKVFAGTRFDVHQMSIRGSDGKLYQREVLRHPGAVVLLPECDDGRLVLIRNRRLTVDQTLLELPAGTRDPDESPLETAARELIEETGFEAMRFDLVHEFFSAPGISDERMWLYRATGLREVGAQREAIEEIENEIADADQIRRWLAGGDVQDGKTLVGLYAWLAMQPPDPKPF
ncbi:MAG: NUDIX hydrolase [Planctomycetota bacterium]